MGHGSTAAMGALAWCLAATAVGAASFSRLTRDPVPPSAWSSFLDLSMAPASPFAQRPTIRVWRGRVMAGTVRVANEGAYLDGASQIGSGRNAPVVRVFHAGKSYAIPWTGSDPIINCGSYASIDKSHFYLRDCAGNVYLLNPS